MLFRVYIVYSCKFFFQEEFCARLSRADTAVAKIPKKALMEILDRLHITFSLPADGWKKRREKKQNLRMRK